MVGKRKINLHGRKKDINLCRRKKKDINLHGRKKIICMVGKRKIGKLQGREKKGAW